MSSLLPGGCPPSPAVTLRLPPVMLHPPLPRGSQQGPFLPRKPAVAVPVPHGVLSGLGAAHKCCELLAPAMAAKCEGKGGPSSQPWFLLNRGDRGMWCLKIAQGVRCHLCNPRHPVGSVQPGPCRCRGAKPWGHTVLWAGQQAWPPCTCIKRVWCVESRGAVLSAPG